MVLRKYIQRWYVPPQFSQSLAQFGVLQIRMFAGQLSTGLLRINHKTIHWPFDVIIFTGCCRSKSRLDKSRPEKRHKRERQRERCENGIWLNRHRISRNTSAVAKSLLRHERLFFIPYSSSLKYGKSKIYVNAEINITFEKQWQTKRHWISFVGCAICKLCEWECLNLSFRHPTTSSTSRSFAAHAIYSMSLCERWIANVACVCLLELRVWCWFS